MVKPPSCDVPRQVTDDGGMMTAAGGRPAQGNADRTVAAFAARLKDTVDLNSGRQDLAAVVDRTLEPAHVSVWINERR